MTDPNDETQPQPTAGAGASPPDAVSPTGETASPGASAATGDGAPAPSETASTEPPAAGTPPLRANRDRPADSGWREPAWIPPRDGGRRRDRERRSGRFAIVVGLILIAAGLYAFIDRTLGIALPAIHWSSLWPVILILIGGLILVRSFQRRA